MKKKVLSILLAFFAIATTARAQVVLNETNFPDANFRAALASKFGISEGDEITEAKIAATTSLDVNGRYKSTIKRITDLTGIEYFTALKRLKCYENQLTSLDVSKNTALTELQCYKNQLTSLDVSECTALTTLECDNNQLTSLNVSGCTVLTTFECGNNQLAALDVSKNTAIKILRCYSNLLTTLDVSKNTELEDLNCSSNQLTMFDVSNNTALTRLVCYGNQLTNLDVSGCTALTSLLCYSNQLPSLDVSGLTALTRLDCYSNQLISLNVLGCTALERLDCQDNQLSSLNVSGCTAMKVLYCRNNQLTLLNMSGCTALTTLSCHSNQLISLDVSHNISLTQLVCDNNQLTSLDVSNNTELTYLDCFCNLIKGEEMDAVITSLPTVVSGEFRVINTKDENEGNVCTKSQVAVAKEKGWRVCDYNGGVYDENYEYPEYEGSDPADSGNDIEEDTDISQIDNTIYIERAEAVTGSQLRLSIKMKNTIEVQGYQFDLYLPEGVSFATDEEGFVLAELSSERTTPKKMNSFDTAIQADGALRVLCGSSKGYTFDGTDGEVAIITLNIDSNMEEGEYPLILKTVKLSDRNAVPYSTDYLKSTLAIYSYTLADANGDSSIDVADYIAVANYILGNAPNNFVSKAADINGDNSIDVADYIGVANLILSGAGATQAPSLARLSAKTPRRAPTNISTLDDAIYVSPITAAPGTQQELSIQMKNSSNVVGFEFSLELPDGITVALDGDNMPMTELSTERTTTKRTTSFDSAIQPNGTLKVLCGTTAQNSNTGKLYTFNGNEGEIARITIEVPANYEEGVYEVSILNALFADEDAKKTTLQTPIVSELTIGENSIVLDENDTAVPDATTGNVNILVKRTIKANEWSTICLPFDMTEEQLHEAFGDDVQLQEFVSYDATYDANDEVVGIVVNFQNVNLSEGLYGNYPYLIKTSNAISEFSVNATIAPDEENTIAEYDNGRTGKARKVWGSFIGTYHAQTTVPANGLFISGNNFWYSVGNTKMKAFRAYFMFDDVLSSLNAASAKITWMFDGQPTSIDEVEFEKIADGAVYTIQGQLVGRDIDMERLPSGIYIVNGQKVVIK